MVYRRVEYANPAAAHPVEPASTGECAISAKRRDIGGVVSQGRDRRALLALYSRTISQRIISYS